MKNLREIVKEKILILDGAMGTEIQKYNLTEEDFRGKRFRDLPVAYWQSTAFDYRYTGLVFLPVVPNLCQLKRCPAFSQICHLPIQLSVLIDCGFAVLFVDI